MNFEWSAAYENMLFLLFLLSYFLVMLHIIHNTQSLFSREMKVTYKKETNL